MTERSEPLVSVVTPFYNTAEFLPECIESVLRQTYQNWEYVLVDNRSTDGSGDIARRYAAQDPRLRVVRNDDFLNQVQNYNRALSLISDQSEYTKMLEADNWLYPECLTQMVALAEGHPRVGIVGGYCVTEHMMRFLGLPLAVTVVGGRELARMHFLERVYLFGAPTTVLLRSGMVRSRKPFYDESTWLVEDLSACFELLREWDFGFVHQVLTFVRTQNDDSIQFGRRSFETWMLDRFAVLIRHGRDFLDPSEYRATYRETRSLYYSRLAFGVIHRKGPEFWEYHRAALATVGARLERGRLARHVALEILRMASNPGQSLMALARYLKSAWRDRHGEAERAPQSPAGL